MVLRTGAMRTKLLLIASAGLAIALPAIAQQVVPLLADGSVRSHVDRVFAWTDVAEAFDYLGSSGKQGKVLLDFSV